MNQPSSTDSSISPSGPASDAVSRRAYEIWEREGRPEGCDFRHWLQAEQELGAEQSSSANERGASPAAGVRATGSNSGRNDSVDTRPLSGTRGAPSAGRDTKRNSGAPFATEKNGASSAGGHSASRRKPVATPAL